MLIVTDSEFLRHLHEYEAEGDCSVVSTSPCSSVDERLTAIISRSSSSDITLSSSVTSPHRAITPSLPSVNADSDMPESKRCNPLDVEVSK